MAEMAERASRTAATPPTAQGSSATRFGGWRLRLAQFYSLAILFSLPLFSIPCQKGTCSSPVEVVSITLFLNGADETIVKTLLYPGLVFSKIEAVVSDNKIFAFPDWNNVLKDANFIIKEPKEEERSLPRFGFVIGSYLCIIGSFLSLFGINWISACGMLTLLWYIYTLGRDESDIFAYPMFGITMFCVTVGLLKLQGTSRQEPVEGGDSKNQGDGKGRKRD